MAVLKTLFECGACGWTNPKWVGRCGECQAWNTVEQRSASLRSRVGVLGGAGGLGSAGGLRLVASAVARPITEVAAQMQPAHPTGVGEFDRVLGGGLVPGSVVLLSGEPGVGKSTLLLEVAVNAARGGLRVLYITGEESVNQVRLRATRTNALDERLFLAAETDLATVLGQFDAISPDLAIVDSVQTIASGEVEGAAGMPSQVREVAAALIRVAKSRELPLILVGHVTKDGAVAGPRTLEHLVDVVCHFEGDRNTALRFVRSLKNRYGPTDEVGCFEMTQEGIGQVPDPSGLFMSQRAAGVPGSCITVAAEGKRTMIVEVQALVNKTNAPQPRRVTNGVDGSRLAMLIAVLERRAGIKVSEHDVYVSSVGGVKLSEPAADLAIAIAIASALYEKPVAHNLAAYGEISLAGQVRPVTNARARASEASRLGFVRNLDSTTADLRSAIALALG